MKKTIVIIILSLSIISISLVLFLENKKNTLGSLAYNKSKKENLIYIQEDNEYKPYLVLHNNYNKSGNTLLLRLNTVGNDEEFVIDYNSTISEEKIYSNQLKMQENLKYYETDVDEFLNGEFLNRFDASTLNIIKNTKLNFLTYINGNIEKYDVERQIFILSDSELGIDNPYDISNINYFNSNKKRIASNDVGRTTIYWTRTYGGGQTMTYHTIGLNGSSFVFIGTQARYSIRPAMAIPSKTKIKEIYDKKLDKKIYVLDI